MTDEKWRSPNNDYGPEVGLDNGDVETFKKEPEEALARETGQNSNDARYNSSYTKMEYKLFEVEHDAIPGIDELSEMIEACYEYKKELPKEAVPLKRMLERSHDKKIKCLRISDFHTSGLEGVLSNDAEKPFYLLTKGSGISYKMCGDGSDTYTLDIISAEVDGKPCRIEDGKVRMKLSKDVTYVVKYTTNRKSMFSSEVIMNAYR